MFAKPSVEFTNTKSFATVFAVTSKFLPVLAFKTTSWLVVTFILFTVTSAPASTL